MQNKLADAGATGLRAGLVGAGVIAEPHAACLKRLPGVVPAAVCDLDSARARAFAARWGIPETYGSLEGMLAGARLDVVHILLPPPAHAAAAVACLEAGCHIFLEKPACISSSECRAVEAAAQRAGRAVGVNHNLTYMPAYTRLLETARRRRLGAVEHVVVAYHLPAPVSSHWMFQAPGNLVLEIGPHPASLIYPLIGRALEVSAVAAGKTVWQVSTVCERGTAQLYISAARDYLANWCYAVGQDGEAFADLRRNSLRITEKTRYPRAGDLLNAGREARDLAAGALGGFLKGVAGSAGFGPGNNLQTVSMEASIRAFYAALLNGETPPVDIREGAAAVEICELAIAAAAGAGREARHALA